MRFLTEDKAITIANDTYCGLATSLFTSSVKGTVGGTCDNAIRAHGPQAQTIRAELFDHPEGPL